MMMKYGFSAAILLSLAACGPSVEAPSEPTAPQAEAVKAATIDTVNVSVSDDRKTYTVSWTLADEGPVNVGVSTDPEAEMPEMIAENLDALSFTWSADGPPQRHYFFVSPASGGAPTMAAMRLLPLEGGRNFRDLGGYQTADGQIVKWGHVFRSGVMHTLTDADYDYLSSIGIKTLCDFRDVAERNDEPTEWRAGDLDYLVFSDPPEQDDPRDNPMFAALLDPASTPEDVEAAMAEGYWEIAVGEREGYTAMFDQLAEGDIPLAFNCSAGKDRAGTAAALVLTALGVPRETVVMDYSLSDDYVDYMAEFLNDEARAKADADPDHPYRFLFEMPPEKLEPLMASPKVYIETSFDRLETEYGSVMGFIQNELDVTDTELAAIRAALLE